MHRGRRQYLVRWLGYESDEDTWEDGRNIHDPELKAALYERERASKRASDEVTQDSAPQSIPPGWIKITDFGKFKGYRGPAGSGLRAATLKEAWRMAEEA
eukprot:5849037-Prymnesium_polylepis.1